MRVRRARAGATAPLVLVASVLASALAGCSTGARTVGSGPAVTLSEVPPTPAPVTTIRRSGPTFRIGTTGTLHTAQAGVGLTVTAKGPALSRTRLSPSYGYAPQRGWYVTVTVVLHNTGSVPLLVSPKQFYVEVPGLGKVTTEDGSAPYSGASSQLDQTTLAGGQSLSGALTFDVSSRHGTFVYAPSGSPALSWTY